MKTHAKPKWAARALAGVLLGAVLLGGGAMLRAQADEEDEESLPGIRGFVLSSEAVQPASVTARPTADASGLSAVQIVYIALIAAGVLGAAGMAGYWIKTGK